MSLEQHGGEGLDVEARRRDFPILSRQIRDKPLVYLDNAATTQKPQAVIDRLVQYYSAENANIHRGVHLLSQEATFAYERARGRVQHFIGAGSSRQVIFVRGTTEGINLVAQTFAQAAVGPGDEILVSHMEHHSNIVPWQMLCQQRGAELRVVPIDERGQLDLAAFEALLGERTKLVAVTHASNALGTVNPIRQIADMAHANGAKLLVDGAQAVSHMPVDVGQLDCDFYVFSGHKLFGPTGIGVLWGREELLEEMPPYQGGGEMIKSVSFDKTIYAELPGKFEGGTPNIAGAIALEAAIDYVNQVGFAAIGAHEADLLAYGTRVLEGVPGLRLIGTAEHKVGVLSFVLEKVHPHDIGTFLDVEGIAIRTGHHCAEPVMRRFGVAATARASLALYNTRGELDQLAAALEHVNEVLG